MTVKIEIQIEREGDISVQGRREVAERVTEAVESLSHLGRVTANTFINGVYAGAAAPQGKA